MGFFSEIRDSALTEARQSRIRQEAEDDAALQNDTPPRQQAVPRKVTPPAPLEATPATAPISVPPAPAPIAATPATAPIAATPAPPPVSDDKAAAESVKRIKAETERITRRNMKDCVAEYLAELCAKDPDLARKVIQPQKSMVKCFSYITKKAKEYAEQERKDTGNTEAAYGCDVPDDLCYQWAVDYFNDPNADKEPERKAPQKAATATTRTPNRTPAAAKTPAQPKADAPVGGSYEQMSLLGGLA